MKKICSILSALALSIGVSTSVAACNGGIGTSLKYTDQEKILSIYNLTEDQLVNNGVKINSLMTDQEDIKELITTLELEKFLDKNSIGKMIKDNLGFYIMANQFLNEISTKVPGYGWIANKLTWQSQWSLKDLLNVKEGNKNYDTWGLYNNVSGWMNEANLWSISVTFLDDQLLGWNGELNPAYARININRKLVADNNGLVKEEESNPEGIHKQPNEEPNVVDPVINEHQQEKGVIYQGYSNSSKLFSLNRILTGKKAKVPIGIFNYSPSVADFVNNKIINLDFGNIILQNGKQLIEKALNEYLLENPVYLVEGMESLQIDNIVKNQIYVVMLGQAIDRDNLKDKDGKPIFDEDDKEATRVIVNTMLTTLYSIVDGLKSKNWTNKTLLEEFKVMLTTIRNDESKFVSVNKTQFTSKFKEVINDSRNKIDAFSNQSVFYSKYLNAVLYKEAGEFLTVLADQDSYFDFGFDASYKFKVFYWSISTPKEGEKDQWYSPDNNRKPEDYIADKGFRNVFLGQRLMTSPKSYNLLNHYINQLPNRALGLDILGLENSSLSATQNNLETIMLEKLKEAISIDKQQDTIGINHDSWRIYHIIALINKYATEKLREVFGYDSSGNIELHNKKVSLDYSKSVNEKNDFSKADDDIAFAQLFKNGQINITTKNEENLETITASKQSDIRNEIYKKGIISAWTESQYRIQSMYVGKLNIYGKRLDSDDNIANIDKWTQVSSRKMGSFEYIMNINNNWKPLLEAYWKKYVSNNKNNPDYNAEME